MRTHIDVQCHHGGEALAKELEVGSRAKGEVTLLVSFSVPHKGPRVVYLNQEWSAGSS